MSPDSLSVLRGNDIVINENIIIHQPTLNDIADIGEQKFFNTFYSLCSIPSDMKSVLWDVDIDYMKLSDWQLFIMLSRNYHADDTGIVFGNLDFASMQPMSVMGTKEIVLVRDDGMIITEEIYQQFIAYLRMSIGYVVKRENAANKTTKMFLIQEDYQRRRMNEGKEYQSILLPIVLTLVNTEEFSYTYDQAFDLTIYRLMRSYFQIQNKKAACALYQGSMSGFVDTSKIKKSSFSWIYDESKFT